MKIQGRLENDKRNIRLDYLIFKYVLEVVVMAKPKDEEELQIYKELLEKYKDNDMAMEMIQGLYNRQKDTSSWKLMKATLGWIEG